MSTVTRILLLCVLFISSWASANDRADEYAPITRLSNNYQVNERKQNYDAFKFPTSINNIQEVEGDKTYINYSYKNRTVNASRLQFQRHFEKLVADIGGEIVYAGQSVDYRFGVTFKFPQKGRTAWALASTRDHKDIYHYRVMVIETNQPWGGSTAPTPAPKPVAVEPEPVKPTPQAVRPAPTQPTDEPISLDNMVVAGLDYIVSEYALDMQQYTACSMILAKNHSVANFDKVKREFINSFPQAERKDLEEFFYGDDMARLKEKLVDRGIMRDIENAKQRGGNMNAGCNALIAKLINWNDEARANWRKIRARAVRD